MPFPKKGKNQTAIEFLSSDDFRKNLMHSTCNRTSKKTIQFYEKEYTMTAKVSNLSMKTVPDKDPFLPLEDMQTGHAFELTGWSNLKYRNRVRSYLRYHGLRLNKKFSTRTDPDRPDLATIQCIACNV